DLQAVQSYGFRGEALASISSVSRFEMISSEDDEGEGWKIAMDGKTIVDASPAPHARGTTVRVRDLFFNTPARKRFLKSDLTERRRILETVLSFALISPELDVHYTEDDKPVLDLIPGSSWKDRVSAILGATTMKHMVKASLDSGDVRVHGFISLPTYTRANRNHQFLFINRRLVREKTMMRAIQQAYRSVIPAKRFPVIVLSLELPFDEIDVNVHPTKLEVRIRKERQVFDAVHRAIKQALSGRTESALGVRYSRDDGDQLTAAKRAGMPAYLSEMPSTSAGAKEPVPVDAYRHRVRDAYGSYLGREVRGAHDGPQLGLKTETKSPATDTAEDEVKGKLTSEESLFWQFNNAYIFIQVRGGIVVIDQHAAHERIIFDTSKKRLADEIPVTQQILFPIPLELSLAELSVFNESKSIFVKLGFHLEPFGGTSILVRGYPQGVKNWSEGRLLQRIFDDIVQERFPGESHADKIIASYSCRSAIKAGQKLSIDEMRDLADQLFAVENPYSCPHGRPTIRRLTLEEIGSWFHRR
ncbi:MAG: DNA mismatch repair endonuclease MutL, partial [bacterium]|nr:DNA mismatch repair endonuclease MutL [bacterium]